MQFVSRRLFSSSNSLKSILEKEVIPVRKESQLFPIQNSSALGRNAAMMSSDRSRSTTPSSA